MEIKPVLLDKVDLGSGTVRKEGYLRVDHDVGVNPDLCFDLEVKPWPLSSDFFREIYCSHVVEHLSDTRVFLSETVRIAKAGASFRFEFPHYSVASIEPDHRRGYGLHALALFPQFKVEWVKLEWSPHREGKSLFYYVLDEIITRLANLNPYVTERVFCYWVGGFSNVVLTGRIEKRSERSCCDD